MDIIKRLQLNKNPKDIKSGSIIGAKNIMLDPISSSITNEYGFKIAFDCEKINDLKNYKIVGSIPCNEEVVIFLYNSIDKNSKICKYNEKDNSVSYLNNWNWEGGKVIGTFAYNYKGELILAVSEILENNNKEIPLKIINFTKGISTNLDAELPTFSSYYQINQNGFLVCGVYTFFVRFKIEENTYSKWIQLTDDIIIIDAIEKEAPVHHFEQINDNSKGYVNTTDFKKLFVNTNLKSNKAIVLDTYFNYNDNNINLKELQIGYIIKHDTSILGRILGNYNINDVNSLTINFETNSFIEEVDVKEFLEDPHQFYNVKNLINYNNRLYISNYSEYKKYTPNDLNSLLNSVILEYKHTVILDDNEVSSYNVTLDCDKVPGSLNYENPLSTLNNTDSIELLKSLNFYANVKAELEEVLVKLANLKITQPYSPNFPYDLKKAELYIIDNDRRNTSCIWNYDNIRNEETWSNFIIFYENNKFGIRNTGFPDIIDLSNAKWELICTSISSNTFTNNRSSKCILQIGDVSGIYKQNYDIDLYYNFNLNQIKKISQFREVGTKYNNNRTLIPGQIYNFFIHFIRPDLSVTDGYKINKNTQFSKYSTLTKDWTSFNTIKIKDQNYYFVPFIYSSSLDNNNGILIKPRFGVDKNELKSKGFIGYFISYEKIERNVLDVIPINFEFNNEDSLKYICYTNSELIYDGNNINGKQLELFTDTTTRTIDDNKRNNKIINKIDKYLPYNTKQIKIAFEKEIDVQNEVNSKTSISQRHCLYTIPTDIYNSKVKTLYQLTPMTFVEKKSNNVIYTDEDRCYMYLPGFFNNEKVITYDKDVILGASQNRVYDYSNNNQPTDSYAIKAYVYGTYSQYPLNAYSIKQDYEKGAVTINNKVYANSVLSPSKLSDFLELKEAYTSLPVKSYTNYQDSTITTFDKTIYRSDVISDESSYNGFRHFSPENYKNITENKGKIINIIGVGLYLLVHTEYSLFAFDRNNQLSDNAQLQIPDVFDIDYKELTPSTNGFGGLKNKEESIFTKNGYIWFDRINKSIFIFDGQIKPISSDIHTILENIFYEYYFPEIKFAEDYISNRLLICVKYQSGNRVYHVTLSYSFNTNTFISSHDYSFDENYKTYNRSYFFKKGQATENKLYTFSKYSFDYLDLGNFGSGLNIITENNKLCSYIDIIFNDLYEHSKTLNSISYIMSRNNDFNFNTNIIDKYFNTDFDNEKHQNKLRLYSGFKLFICTDLTFSGELDISKIEIKEGDSEEEILKKNNLKITRPSWNNGVWNFNWFRENIKKDVTNDELQQQNVNNQMKEVYQQHNNLYPSGLEKSDMRSLINGKYFIFRFVFERNIEDLNLKFETLDVNISKL